jgi:hypothetical protein
MTDAQDDCAAQGSVNPVAVSRTWISAKALIRRPILWRQDNLGRSDRGLMAASWNPNFEDKVAQRPPPRAGSAPFSWRSAAILFQDLEATICLNLLQDMRRGWRVRRVH